MELVLLRENFVVNLSSSKCWGSNKHTPKKKEKRRNEMETEADQLKKGDPQPLALRISTTTLLATKRQAPSSTFKK
jgi:hypothetical protein